VLALAEALRSDPALLARLCPDVSEPRTGGLHDLMQALALAEPVADELDQLNTALRRVRPLEAAAAKSRDPTAALAYLKAADRVIQVDDVAQ
jgi:acyl-CoA dehydrogenase